MFDLGFTEIIVIGVVAALVVTFTSPFVSPDVQRSFFCQLTQMGLPITLTTNLAEFETEER